MQDLDVHGRLLHAHVSLRRTSGANNGSLTSCYLLRLWHHLH